MCSVCLGVYQACGEESEEPEEDPGPAYPCPAQSYSDPALYGPDGLPTFRPLIIAHRGSSGMYPEHTALGYRKAAEQGADLIECDLAITKVSSDHRECEIFKEFIPFYTDFIRSQ